jgi:secreted PhoX family phosphatase
MKTNMTSRRTFLKRAGIAAGGIITGTTLATLAQHSAAAAEIPSRARANRRRSEYGDVRPIKDRDGNTVLALPEGFQYVTFSRTGETYAPGLTVPRNHDGMACFEGASATVRLIRNHEVRNRAADFTLGVDAPAHLRYDRTGMGGCMKLDFDTEAKRLVRQFVAIGGTIVNCAGGYSYRNSGWITCEETLSGVKEGFERPHGYAFYVPASADAAVAAVPLKAMGRFAHEAAVAAASGLVYETEDAGNTSGFYRFTPREPTDLSTGRLQMLAVNGAPGATLYTGQTTGVRLPVHWVDIANPDPDLEHGAATCFAQGRAQGGAAFNRLEGIYRGEDGESVYFVSTSGGDKRSHDGVGYGQLWRYLPAAGARKDDELVLVFESPAGSVLESPDNLCVTPNGGILFCEDDAIADADRHPLAPAQADVNRLVGLGAKGEPFTFAVNLHNNSEFAGACFSPDGEILFVNIFGDGKAGSGMTAAIWGPWADGPL